MYYGKMLSSVETNMAYSLLDSCFLEEVNEGNEGKESQRRVVIDYHSSGVLLRSSYLCGITQTGVPSTLAPSPFSLLSFLRALHPSLGCCLERHSLSPRMLSRICIHFNFHHSTTCNMHAHCAN